ncbi:MAG: hypothetical protein AB1646_13320 [Thermodesulfobacteriota bacterium]
MFKHPIHPADLLTEPERHRIYFFRVVNLAVKEGLIPPTADSEVGHFAFSDFYAHGRELDRDLRTALRDFEARFPRVARAREDQNTELWKQDPSADLQKELRQELILIGASHAVWPTGTSFVLTYPWTLEGTPAAVRFRDDLSEFMRRRIRVLLTQAGKIGDPSLLLDG